MRKPPFYAGAVVGEESMEIREMEDHTFNLVVNRTIKGVTTSAKHTGLSRQLIMNLLGACSNTLTELEKDKPESTFTISAGSAIEERQPQETRIDQLLASDPLI